MLDMADAYLRYDAERERELDRMPKCAECGEPIQDEHCYKFGHEFYCEQCVKDNHRVWTDELI